eukprot:m.200873 g.200873  ORF g.200873 m.200873 type:complete len:445 (-) comp32779_c0_seq1:11-1345(-)
MASPIDDPSSGMLQGEQKDPPPPPTTSQPRRRQGEDGLKSVKSVNWLIHAAFISKQFEKAESIADAHLEYTGNQCEYAMFIKALIKRRQGSMQESLDLFQQAMYLNPLNHENAKQVARSLVLMSRFVAAIDVYDQIILKGARDWHVLHNRGVCLSHVGRLDEAKACLQEALALHKHDMTFLQLGKFFMMEGKIVEAIDTYLEALKYSPENVELFTTLGLLYLQISDTRKAFDYFGRALTYNPRDTTAILGAASVIQECDDFDVALTKYRVSAAIAPESAELWNNIGMCFFGLKKLIAAIACLKHAHYLSPFHWKVCFNLGLVHLKAQQYASAFQYLSAAVNLQPDFPESYMLLGTALSYLDDTANAATAFKKAIELDSESPMAHLNYALVLYADGDYAGATTRLQQFEKLFVSIKDDETGPEMREAADKLATFLVMGQNNEHQQ